MKVIAKVPLAPVPLSGLMGPTVGGDAGAAPVGADTLPWRASLLAHLLATQSCINELAGRLGVKPDQVAVVDPSFALPLVDTDTAAAAAKVNTVVAPYVLTPSVPSDTLPIISLQSAAPTLAV